MDREAVGAVVDSSEAIMSSKVNQYAGLRSNANNRTKYKGCEYREICGGTARLLTQKEIDEFRFHVEQVMSRQLPKKVSL